HLRSLVAAGIETGRFVPLRLAGPPILGEIVVAFRTRRDMPPLIQEFVRFARAELERSDAGQTPKTPTPARPGGRAVASRRARRRR
ncbi:MAG: hypothetical protein ACREF4_04200, partial [Gammaproteobacteria bacterium]